MSEYWLPGAVIIDLSASRGNGPFQNFLGVILHVNAAENGTPPSFWGAGPATNPDGVCPNFQVYKDGTINQMLPLNWQPSCQVDGNTNYAAIETAGLPTEPLTAAQLASCARIVTAYAQQMGMPLILANTPGQKGLGTHGMGGQAWGGHPLCPGDIRSHQRDTILALANGQPTTTTGDDLPVDQKTFNTLMTNWFMQGPGTGGDLVKQAADRSIAPTQAAVAAMQKEMVTLQTDITAIKNAQVK